MKLIFFVNKFKDNWKSGIAVSLISLPLAVTLAVASHATPVQGVITAIWAGFIASLFGGSNYNIIGPTGALSGLLASYAIIHGVQVLPMLALLSGLFLFVAYLFNLERYLFFIPSSTIAGFVLGVACIIIFNQLNFALGISHIPVHETFIANVIESCKHMGSAAPAAIILFIITLSLLCMLARLLPHIPGAIIISPFAIGLGYVVSTKNTGLSLTTLQAKFSNLHPHLNLPITPNFSASLILPALTIAIISILETLISARIADNMTKTKHSQSKEMLGLSLANIASGLAGGIPATAALARTTLNIKSGCTHKISATISSFAIILISFMFLGYFTYMPLPVIAAILTLVGIHMVEFKQFQQLFAHDKKQFFIAMLVAAVTVLEDPIIGIIFGAISSMILFMINHAHGQFEINRANIMQETISPSADPDTVVYSIKGSFAYINAQSHVHQIEKQVAQHKHVVLDLSSVCFIDQDGLEACEEIIDLLKREKKSVHIIEARETVVKTMVASRSFNELIIKNTHNKYKAEL
jgi:sulfate permease, SulP family